MAAVRKGYIELHVCTPVILIMGRENGIFTFKKNFSPGCTTATLLPITASWE